jgi:hypothetical protein
MVALPVEWFRRLIAKRYIFVLRHRIIMIDGRLHSKADGRKGMNLKKIWHLPATSFLPAIIQ